MFHSQLPLSKPYWQIININFYKANNNIFSESLEAFMEKLTKNILVIYPLKLRFLV